LPPPENTYPRIPSVDVLLRDETFADLLNRFGRDLVLDIVRGTLEGHRATISAGEVVDVSPAAIARLAERELHRVLTPTLKRVFNLTGTILHTNLGRSPLPEAAISAMVSAAGTVNLEYDLGTGSRGRRDSHVEDWIRRLTGAEAAVVVNNNAAAVLIALNTLSLGQDAIVSRGELIEIGGAFRMPDIMHRAGCILREVGTTNRTHFSDFDAAAGPDTGLILKVHTSNYQIQGFTRSVSETEIATLARRHGIPFLVDLGSGTLVDLDRFGLPHERTVRESLQDGADLVTFSGDKLLGGPQAGIIAGRADLIARIAENPMKRALRADKITLAGLSAVLRLYSNPDKLAEHLPALAMLGRSPTEIHAQARRLEPLVAAALEKRAEVRVVPSQNQIGSGSLPVDILNSHALALTPLGPGDKALRDLALALRALPCPVIGRTSNGRLLLDLRALTAEDEFLQQLHMFAI